MGHAGGGGPGEETADEGADDGPAECPVASGEPMGEGYIVGTASRLASKLEGVVLFHWKAHPDEASNVNLGNSGRFRLCSERPASAKGRGV